MGSNDKTNRIRCLIVKLEKRLELPSLSFRRCCEINKTIFSLIERRAALTVQENLSKTIASTTSVL